MGSAAGAMKRVAARIGLSPEEYAARVNGGEKWCTGCKDWRDRGSFGSDSSRSDGKAATCLRCRRSTKQPDRPGTAERREKRALGLAWCRGCRKWLAAVDVTQGACRAHLNAEYRSHYAADSGAIRARANARKRGLEPIPDWWAADCRTDFGGLCAYGCGRPGKTWEHIWPVKRGGISVPGNLVPCCSRCNSRKRHNDPTPWVARGIKAFSEQWAELIALATLHGSDDWIERMEAA